MTFHQNLGLSTITLLVCMSYKYKKYRKHFKRKLIIFNIQNNML